MEQEPIYIKEMETGKKKWDPYIFSFTGIYSFTLFIFFQFPLAQRIKAEIRQ